MPSNIIVTRSCFVLYYAASVLTTLFNTYRVTPTDCSSGWYAVLGNGTCLRCPKGKYCPTKTAAPLDCPSSTCLSLSFYSVPVKHWYSKHTFNKFTPVVKRFKLVLKLLDITNYVYNQSKSIVHGTLL